ncbi:Dabb family protein [Pedobacter xixiisoli]|uniref:Stress responsive A/B Barrel Domain n=1 Tax=Pedobacter xixiisoli TaxID=1476464 RepID=A0A285ZR80_9SPHI|nr:Dabb family protein [Pedobacter xixiisoli]SOD12130.1 Stress responsive A/B Barrel Domain [Pedobacter xixiisoli]
MKRKQFIGATLLSLILGKSLAQETKKDKRMAQLKKGTIIHVVYFWLKEGISKEEEQDFLRYFDVLETIPQVQTLNFGKPAPTTKREVVDHSYSYNLICTFKNLEDITIYENHPTHVVGAKKFSKYWTRVEVKDTQLM